MIKKLLRYAAAGLALYGGQAAAQDEYYLVTFKDKANNPYSLSKPGEFLTQKSIARRTKQGISLDQRDLPVTPAYMDLLKSVSVNPFYSTRWFNGALVKMDTAKVKTVKALAPVKGITRLTAFTGGGIANHGETPDKWLEKPSPSVLPKNTQKTMKLDYGPSLNQVKISGIDAMHEKGYHGEGMTIAVLDNGFTAADKADKMPVFDSLYKRNRVLGTWDFYANNSDVYNDGNHGTSVLSLIGGYAPGQLISGAYNASYYLFLTEIDAFEYPLEEVTWLIAAERADSLGVDIINTSLGYGDFDGSIFDRPVSALNGNTAIITKAADFAAASGIVVVISAGNEGSAGISAPADADSVLAIGGVNPDGTYWSSSSIGNTADGRVKPDVAAQGNSCYVARTSGAFGSGSGTSYAAPLTAGMVAGFWQAKPNLTAKQVVEAIRQSGSIYKTPNKTLGYGIAHFDRAMKPVLANEEAQQAQVFSISPNPTQDKLTIRFAIAQKQTEIQIFNATGQKVLAQRIGSSEGETTIDLGGMPKGVYLLKVAGEGFSQTSRFVKE